MKDAKTFLLIESYALRQALKKVGAGNPSMTVDTKVVVMPWPYELIYHKEQERRSIAEAYVTKKEDIEIMLREVEQRQNTERMARSWHRMDTIYYGLFSM